MTTGEKLMWAFICMFFMFGLPAMVMYDLNNPIESHCKLVQAIDLTSGQLKPFLLCE